MVAALAALIAETVKGRESFVMHGTQVLRASGQRGLIVLKILYAEMMKRFKELRVKGLVTLQRSSSSLMPVIDSLGAKGIEKLKRLRLKGIAALQRVTDPRRIEQLHRLGSQSVARLEDIVAESMRGLNDLGLKGAAMLQRARYSGLEQLQSLNEKARAALSRIGVHELSALRACQLLDTALGGWKQPAELDIEYLTYLEHLNKTIASAKAFEDPPHIQPVDRSEKRYKDGSVSLEKACSS